MKQTINSPDERFPHLLLPIAWSGLYADNLGSVRVFGDGVCSGIVNNVFASYNYNRNFLKQLSYIRGNFLGEHRYCDDVTKEVIKDHKNKFFGHHIITNCRLDKQRFVDSKETLVSILENDFDFFNLGETKKQSIEDAPFIFRSIVKFIVKKGFYQPTDYSPKRVMEF